MDREKVIEGLRICIDRVPGKYTCDKCPYETHGNECEIDLSEDALALLKEQPEIVRCKDCKYVECEGVEGFLVCDLSGFSHSPEFFCADGEMKELYNKAKKEGKENPVQWATYKTSEWVHRKHPGGKVEYKKETTDNPCEDCDRDCGMCGLTLENDWLYKD